MAQITHSSWEATKKPGRQVTLRSPTITIIMIIRPQISAAMPGRYMKVFLASTWATMGQQTKCRFPSIHLQQTCEKHVTECNSWYKRLHDYSDCFLLIIQSIIAGFEPLRYKDCAACPRHWSVGLTKGDNMKSSLWALGKCDEPFFPIFNDTL